MTMYSDIRGHVNSLLLSDCISLIKERVTEPDYNVEGRVLDSHDDTKIRDFLSGIIFHAIFAKLMDIHHLEYRKQHPNCSSYDAFRDFNGAIENHWLHHREEVLASTGW